jgi:hypothetical protein
VLVVDALGRLVDLDAVDSVYGYFRVWVFAFQTEGLCAHEHRLCLQGSGLDTFCQLAQRVDQLLVFNELPVKAIHILVKLVLLKVLGNDKFFSLVIIHRKFLFVVFDLFREVQTALWKGLQG